MTDRCWPSTVTRSRIARTTRCRRAMAARNAVVGFTNMLVGLWEASSRGRSRRLGHARRRRRTATRRFAAYQSGRVFDDACSSSSTCCPRWSALGFVGGKAAGYEADDFLAAAVARGEAWRDALVATSDRDAFQLASERTTMLQPDARRRRDGANRAGRGARALRRRARPGDGLHRASRRSVGQDSRRARHRPEDGRGVAAEHGTLEAVLAAGRFAAEAERLRLYRRMAVLDACGSAARALERLRTGLGWRRRSWHASLA